MNRHFLTSLFGPLLGIVLFSLALVILHHELREYHYAEIVTEVHRIGWNQIWDAIALTVLSYFLLTFYDCLAVRYAGVDLSYVKTAFASFVGYTMSHNLGFPVLTGGAARFRLFSAWGMSPLQIAQALAFSGSIYWLGFSLLMGILLAAHPPPIAGDVEASVLPIRVIGIGFLVLTAGVIERWSVRKRPLKVKDWEFPAFPLPLTLVGLVVAALDWLLAAAVAYAVLPHENLGFMRFVGIFQVSQLLGVLSHVPGGLGVFETVLLLFLGHGTSKSAVVGGLVVYRLIYYLLPFTLSLLLFAAYELRRYGLRLAVVVGQLHTQASIIVPPFFTAAVFLSGVVLLTSGATPAIEERLHLLRELLPLGTIEASHFLGSIAGVSLIILARGLQRRLDAAYALSVGVLLVGVVASLAKGFDYEEAVFLFIVLVLMLPCRKFFYRRASLLRESFSPAWIASIAVVLIAASWLIFFRYKHVEYSHSLWWQFSFSSDAPRSLRATVGAISFALAYGLLRMLAPADAPSGMSSTEELYRAREIIARSKSAHGAIALLGDKSLLFSEEGNAFIMYAVEGQTWVALGDPVGEESEFPDLIWRFRELGDQFGGTCVFYEVGAQNLHYYVETGLDFLKLGEEAIVSLPQFSLDGGSKASLRHTRNKLTKDGWSMRIAPVEEIPALLPRLRRISDSWLETKGAKEKKFSLGYFDPAYMLYFPVALVEREDLLVAFANIWPGDGKTEISVDLMRYNASAPSGVMEFLFTELMLRAKAQGYQRFNLGMAPFSGFEQRKLAPVWNTIGRIVYQHGEKLYNFQGLRLFKDKFGPVWEPRYLAAPGGFALAGVLKNIASLISGGLRGVVPK